MPASSAGLPPRRLVPPAAPTRPTLGTKHLRRVPSAECQVLSANRQARLANAQKSEHPFLRSVSTQLVSCGRERTRVHSRASTSSPCCAVRLAPSGPVA